MDAIMYANILGYGNDYSVFEDGKIWSNKGFRFMKQQKQQKKNGKFYVYVKLSNKGKVTKHYIHRVVATAFIPNPEDKPTVNHKDGNSENNSVDNLEWCTMKEQVDHAWETGLTDTSGSKCSTSKLTQEQVEAIHAMKAAGVYQVNIAEIFNIGTSQVSRILNNQSWHRKEIAE